MFFHSFYCSLLLHSPVFWKKREKTSTRISDNVIASALPSIQLNQIFARTKTSWSYDLCAFTTGHDESCLQNQRALSQEYSTQLSFVSFHFLTVQFIESWHFFEFSDD
jgi:hypothetical protein